MTKNVHQEVSSDVGVRGVAQLMRETFRKRLDRRLGCVVRRIATETGHKIVRHQTRNSGMWWKDSRRVGNSLLGSRVDDDSSILLVDHGGNESLLDVHNTGVRRLNQCNKH